MVKVFNKGGLIAHNGAEKGLGHELLVKDDSDKELQSMLKSMKVTDTASAIKKLEKIMYVHELEYLVCRKIAKYAAMLNKRIRI